MSGAETAIQKLREARARLEPVAGVVRFMILGSEVQHADAIRAAFPDVHVYVDPEASPGRIVLMHRLPYNERFVQRPGAEPELEEVFEFLRRGQAAAR